MESSRGTPPKSESPAATLDRAEKKRRATRKANQRARQTATAAGIKQVVFSLDSELIRALDAMQQRAGLPNRSRTLSQLLTELVERPRIRQELGL